MEFTIGSIHCYGVLGSLGPLWAYEPVMKNVIAAVGGCGQRPLKGWGDSPHEKWVNPLLSFCWVFGGFVMFLLCMLCYVSVFFVFFVFLSLHWGLGHRDLRGRSISVNGVLLRLVDADPCAETIFCLQPELIQA